MTTHLGSARRTRLLRDERLQHELCSSPAHPAPAPPPAPAPRRCDSGPRAWGPERERVVLTPPIRSPISYHAIGYRSILLTCTFHSLKFQFQLVPGCRVLTASSQPKVNRTPRRIQGYRTGVHTDTTIRSRTPGRLDPTWTPSLPRSRTTAIYSASRRAGPKLGSARSP